MPAVSAAAAPSVDDALAALAAGSVVAIWAATLDHVIGREGSMPWRAPADMAHFTAVTTGHPVVMGRRTWESLPPRFRPLPGRTSIVITRDADAAEAIRAEGGAVAATLTAALDLAASSTGSGTIWVAGGGRVYAEALRAGVVDAAMVTVLDLTVPDGDTRAPALDAGFRLVASSPSPTGFAPAEVGPRYRFELWSRCGAPGQDTKTP